MKPTKSDLPQGTLDKLILKVVALGPIHGAHGRLTDDLRSIFAPGEVLIPFLRSRIE